jgi:hypothetical protein
MPGLFTTVAAAEELTTAGCGGLNAAYFAVRACKAHGPRRIASALLALLFAGGALLALLPVHADGALEVALRTPLLVAHITALVLICLGAGR